MNTYADYHGLHPFIALQNEWSLVEPEYLPMCKELTLNDPLVPTSRWTFIG